MCITLPLYSAAFGMSTNGGLSITGGPERWPADKDDKKKKKMKKRYRSCDYVTFVYFYFLLMATDHTCGSVYFIAHNIL